MREGRKEGENKSGQIDNELKQGKKWERHKDRERHKWTKGAVWLIELPPANLHVWHLNTSRYRCNLDSSGPLIASWGYHSGVKEDVSLASGGCACGCSPGVLGWRRAHGLALGRAVERWQRRWVRRDGITVAGLLRLMQPVDGLAHTGLSTQTHTHTPCTSLPRWKHHYNQQ